jgi:hypothetical protein
METLVLDPAIVAVSPMEIVRGPGLSIIYIPLFPQPGKPAGQHITKHGMGDW